MALHTSQDRAARFHALDKGMRTMLVRKLHRFFVAQARRVSDRYRAEFPDSEQIVTQPPQAEELLPDSERNLLWLAVLPFILQTILNTANLAGSLVGLTELDAADPRVQVLLNEAQTRMREVHETTLAAVRSELAEGFSNRSTVGQTALALSATVAETYANRTLTVARTTVATTSQSAALDRYQEAGVTLAYITDGPDCGWTEHDDPDLADGTVRLMVEARQYPIGHPNCARVSLPLR